MTGDVPTRRVFISYSHDSSAHAAAVLAFANRLRADGVDAWIDQYEPNPPEGWPRWMMRQLDEADVVLAVCTARYRRRFEGREAGGVSWEGLLSTQGIYDRGENGKVVPVLLSGAVRDDVPPVLRPYTTYRVPEDYERLFRALVGVPATPAPPLGPLWTPGQASPGAPPPTEARGPSPFVVGPPIERDEDLRGRAREKSLLLEFVGQAQSVQLVGERRMGKTSLLRWLERHPPLGWPVARVDAQGLDGASPGALVRRVAEITGRGAATAGAASPEAALAALCPLVLLVDEADRLAAQGHTFGEGFLDVCRSLVQARRLVWVSASRRELGPLFEETKLTSAFLNDARVVWVGGLDGAAAKGLVADDAAGRSAGGWAYGLQWLGDALWRDPGATDRALDRFAVAAEPVFRGWWDGLKARERAVVGKVLRREGLTIMERRRARGLVDRGLLAEVEAGFGVAGDAWAAFVEESLG